MAIEQMTICEWIDRTVKSTTVERPSWKAVEAALRALDNRSRNDLYLTPDPADPDTWLCIGGGAGRYIVTGSIAGEVFPTVIDPAKPDTPDPEPLVVGGQSARYPANQIVDLATALRAARTFHATGRFEGDVTWVRA